SLPLLRVAGLDQPRAFPECARPQAVREVHGSVPRRRRDRHVRGDEGTGAPEVSAADLSGASARSRRRSRAARLSSVLSGRRRLCGLRVQRGLRAGDVAGGPQPVIATTHAESLSQSAGSPKRKPCRLGSMERSRPVSTPPAPTSTKRCTPCAARYRMDSAQRTGLGTCSYKPCRAAAPVRTSCACQLFTSGQVRSEKFVAFKSAARRSWAGFISAQWNGALTCSRMARRAPAALANSIARFTAP